MERVRELLLGASLPKPLWAECVIHVTTLLNMTLSTNTQDAYRLSCGTIESRLFNICKCLAVLRIDKFDPRAKLCIYLDIPEYKKGYRLMDVKTHGIVYSRDVVINEIDFPTIENIYPFEITHIFISVCTFWWLCCSTTICTNYCFEPASFPWGGSVLAYSFVTEAPSKPPNTGVKRSRYEEEINLGELNSLKDVPEAGGRTSLVLSLLAVCHVPEPKSYNAAMCSSFAQQWRSAADLEYQSLMTNQTWILVHPPKTAEYSKIGGSLLLNTLALIGLKNA
ncbi:Retroelement pol Polyprotein [Phytophthora megakarya]|uniref:Retroelement pol Polyprotein n=1 Tax=Phytophthora megakarya TaxID=4795 RepID=A0A225UBK6_9STRA|nr:Retroelement pol Polyprotein [Phytophthora megakarya]